MPTNGDPCLSNNNGDLMPFEFSLQSDDVFYSLILGGTDKVRKDNRMWFNGTFHKLTGKVISASIGRITSQQSTNVNGT